MNLPCVEDKCILLPICKSKKRVECGPMVDRYISLHRGGYMTSELVTYIKSILPEATTIRNKKYIIHLQL